MKKVLCSLIMCLTGTWMFSQVTNVFPNNGNVGVGLTSPTQKLHVIGSIGVTGAIKGLDAGQSLDFYARSWVMDGSYINLYANDHATAPGQVWITAGNTATGSAKSIVFGTNQGTITNNFLRADHMVIQADGKVKIGAHPVPSGYKLAVEDGIITEKVKVAVHPTDWSDYVFLDEYKLMSLADLRKYIRRQGHLPGVPSTEEVVESGLDLGKMDAKLLEKIEELTLYILQLETRMKQLEAQQN
jgi:hypothetical protein